MKANEPRTTDCVVYRDERFTLGLAAQTPYVVADGVRLTLSCHPYEPCLYITDASGRLTAVHNAFDPWVVLDLFGGGGVVRSITGRRYDPEDFCRMVAYAAGKGDLNIDEAERAFGSGPAQKPAKAVSQADGGAPFPVSADGAVDGFCWIERDPALTLLAMYPDLVVEYGLVQSRAPYCGYESHGKALACACRRLFDDQEDDPWRYDLGRARGSMTTAAAFFTAEGQIGALTYRTAFLSPPYPHGYTEADYDNVNAVLFPNGTAELSVCEWTTDWSDYFDDGHEWWGALCATVYDKSLDRFVVIMASATD